LQPIALRRVNGHLDSGVLRPEHDLARATKFAELVEDHPNGPCNPLIRVHLDLTDLVPAVPRRQSKTQLTAQGLRIARGKPALAQQAQFVLGHRALETKQETIIDQPWVVGPIRIDHQCANQRTQVDEVMPIAAIASEARGFDAKDGAD
jgi:hypothetical protein